MTFTLTAYQATAVDESLIEIRDAQRVFADRGKKTAIGLTAPTGAGKTVIATSVLERLILGDETAPANRDQVVLWVTDAPALNRQTADKMLLASGHLEPGDLVFMDSRFDQKRLEPGKIHFVHIQQLGKGATSYRTRNEDGSPRDGREYDLWDTIANTVEHAGSDFLLVIDEAHRGTGKQVKDAASIVERLSHGGPNPLTGGEHPAAPVIFGISATPERFRKAMNREGRSLEDVVVPIAAVRESGLLKDRIVVRHPGENQPSRETLLGLAVHALHAADEAWAKHHETANADGESPTRVQPMLVVQVPPGTKEADLAPLLSVLETEDPALVGDALAHAFQSHATWTIPGGPNGTRDVRYVAPDRIAEDKRARVVFFIDALTTGWDCPRAEVMLSLRSASDPTAIAQLIGRMVRTPLAKRIEDVRLDERTLNSVPLFLPHYDKQQVAKVIKALNDETGGDTDIEIEPITCIKRTAAQGVPDEVWELLAALPSAARVKRAFPTQTHRLLELARLLRGHDLLMDANAQAQARLVGAVRTEASVRAADMKKALGDVITLDMTATVWDHRVGEFVEDDADGEPTKVEARAGDVDAQFASAVRLLPDATAKWYWNTICDDDPDLDPYEAKAMVAALVKTPELATAVKERVEKDAREQIDAWRGRFANQVAMLGKQARLDFENVWSPRVGTLTVDIEVPETVSAATEKVKPGQEPPTTEDVPVYDHHLYVAAAPGETHGQHKVAPGKFPATLTGWEIDVLDKETGYPTLVGWYRNPARSKNGLAVAYGEGDNLGLLYPDFLFFHEVDGEVVVDVVDPHGHHAADTGPKWAGLARWAAEHRDKVRRVVAVIKVGADLLALDLTGDGIAERLDACSTKADIETVFAEQGGAY